MQFAGTTSATTHRPLNNYSRHPEKARAFLAGAGGPLCGAAGVRQWAVRTPAAVCRWRSGWAQWAGESSLQSRLQLQKNSPHFPGHTTPFPRSLRAASVARSAVCCRDRPDSLPTAQPAIRECRRPQPLPFPGPVCWSTAPGGGGGPARSGCVVVGGFVWLVGGFNNPYPTRKGGLAGCVVVMSSCDYRNVVIMSSRSGNFFFCS